MIARLQSRLATWTAAETAEGVPRPPPAPSLPPRVVDAAVVAVVALLNVALLRCADPGQAEAATSVLNQIARASSSNATATRRLVGSSTASS